MTEITVRCRSLDCGKEAPTALRSRLLLATNIVDIYDLFAGGHDFVDCPLCGSTKSIAPSLAAYFMIQDRLVLLDRGSDPEPFALQALQPSLAAFGAKFVPERVTDLTAFKATFAAQLKTTAQRYPYRRLDSASFQEDLTLWEDLQGEVLTALLAGAQGVVPHFRVQAGDPDGRIEDRKQTVEIVHDLILHLLKSWSLGLTALTATRSLEELLIRLVDSYSPVALIADRVFDMLAGIWDALPQNKDAIWYRFHFLAVDASLHAMVARENPRAGEWAHQYLMVRYAVRRGDVAQNPDRFLLSSTRVAATISYEHAWNAVASLLGSYLKTEDAKERGRHIDNLATATEDLGHPGLFQAVMERGIQFGKASVPSAPTDTPTEEELTPERFAELILDVSAKNKEMDLSALLMHWRFSWYSNAEAVARLFDLLAPSVKRDLEQRANLLAWFGERMKLIGAPAPVLARIGEKAAPWEKRLSPLTRRKLWTERGNALRLAGHREKALKVAMATLEITLADSDAPATHKATAWANYGIMLREIGRFAECEQSLLEAVTVAPIAAQWQPLQSLAATYMQMGRISDAADTFAKARQTAGGADLRDISISLLTSEIAARLRLGQFEAADRLLKECPGPERMPDGGLIGWRLCTLQTQKDEIEIRA